MVGDGSFVGKCSKSSKDHRTKGNLHFVQKNLQAALDEYNMALVFAHKDSEEFYLSLGNRSAVLFESGYLEDCLIDIKRIVTKKSDKLRAEKLKIRRLKAEELLKKSSNKPQNTKDSVELFGGPSKNTPELSSAISVVISKDGRRLVANRDVEPGSVLIVEDPFAHVILPHKSHSHCYNCAQQLPQSWLPCEDCAEDLRFCSESCRDAEKFHVVECGFLAKLHGSGISHLALKTLLSMGVEFPAITAFPVEQEGRVWAESVKKTSNVSWLESHHQDIDERDAAVYTEAAVSLAGLLAKKREMFPLAKELLADPQRLIDTLVRIIEKLICNAHAISSCEDYCPGYGSESVVTIRSQEKIASALFAIASLMNHSCNPNIFTSFVRGKTMVVRATRRIAEGEELFNCYGPKIGRMPKKDRQLALQAQYFFRCHCRDGCDSIEQEINELGMTALRCAHCDGPVQVSGQSATCISCGQSASFSIEGMAMSEHKLRNALEEENFDPGTVFGGLMKLEGLLHANNERLIKLRDEVARRLAEEGHLKVSAEVLRRNLEAIRTLNNSIEVGEELVKLIQLSHGEKKLAEEAKKIFRVYYGSDCDTLRLLAQYE